MLNAELDEATTTSINQIDQEGTYKYLGINERDGFQHSVIEDKILKKYKRRVKLVLKREMNAEWWQQKINKPPVPVFNYSFNIITW